MIMYAGKPEWYALRPAKGNRMAIEVLVLSDAVPDFNNGFKGGWDDNLKDILFKRFDPQIVRAFQEPGNGPRWGFGHLMTPLSQSPDVEGFSSLLVEIPKGKRSFTQSAARDRLNDPVLAHSACWSLLGNGRLYYHQYELPENVRRQTFYNPQLFAFDVVAMAPGDHNLNIEVSPQAVRWLAENHDTIPYKAIGDRMARVEHRLMPHLNGHLTQNWIEVREGGWLFLEASSCTFNPCGYDEADPGNGYSMFGHNIELPEQQAVILVGLAAIWDIVRCGLLGQA